jgi:hypothetical protein
MRDLTRSDKNSLIIDDSRSGTEIQLFYRNPLTEEEVAYQAALYRKHGKKVRLNSYEARLKYGLKILTGFREGDFGQDGAPISADPASPYYRENWKDLLRDEAPDIVTTFAFAIFEGARADTGIDIGFGVDEAEEDIEVNLEVNPPSATS